MNVFFTLYLQSHGYTAFEAGQLWAIGVLAEVVLFFVLPHFIRSIDLRLLLTLSLVFGSRDGFLLESIRMAMALIGLQSARVHFGAIHSVSIEFIRRWFPGSCQAEGWHSIVDSFLVWAVLWVPLYPGLPGKRLAAV